MPKGYRHDIEDVRQISTDAIVDELKRRAFFVFVGTIQELSEISLPDKGQFEIVCAIVETGR